MNAEIQKYMDVLMGKNAENGNKTLTAEDKKKLSAAYFDLFFGLAAVNWERNKKTLGAAWYDALGQLKSLVSTKNKSNPAVMYLNQIQAAHSTKWAQIIMSHPQRDLKFEMDASAKKEWERVNTAKINLSLNAINNTISKMNAMPVQNRGNVSSKDFDAMQQKILFMLRQKTGTQTL